jgi:hypothetical protein
VILRTIRRGPSGADATDPAHHGNKADPGYRGS